MILPLLQQQSTESGNSRGTCADTKPQRGARPLPTQGGILVFRGERRRAAVKWSGTKDRPAGMERPPGMEAKTLGGGMCVCDWARHPPPKEGGDWAARPTAGLGSATRASQVCLAHPNIPLFFYNASRTLLSTHSRSICKASLKPNTPLERWQIPRVGNVSFFLHLCTQHSAWLNAGGY